jgi:hypothetical protein
LKKTQATTRRRQTFKVDALAALLQRFVVAPGSTAGIEQNFSMFKRSLGQQWQGSELAEERRLVLQLASAAAPEMDTKLLAAARVIWATTFGAPRTSNAAQRLPARRQLQQHLRTAAAWLRLRRQHVGDKAVAAIPTRDHAIEAVADSVWTERHDKEVRFQKKARVETHQAAVQQGVIGQDTLGPGAEQQMTDYRQKVLDREAELVAKQSAMARKRLPPQMPDLRGRRIFVDDSAKATLNQTPAQWALARRQLELVVVDDRAVASVFCVLTPSQPGDRVGTVAAQTGGVICTPEMLLSGSGVAMKLHCALSWPRHIFLSTGCHDRHRGIVDLLQRVCSLQRGRCRWTWYLETDGPDRRALFLARARKRGKNHRSELVTLLGPGQNAAYREFPNRMNVAAFLKAIHRVDARFTRLGICGR